MLKHVSMGNPSDADSCVRDLELGHAGRGAEVLVPDLEVNTPLTTLQYFLVPDRCRSQLRFFNPSREFKNKGRVSRITLSNRSTPLQI